MAKDDFAVVVGISRYPSIGDLKGPENDALNFRKWLIEGGGQVPPENITSILSSDFPASKNPRREKPTTELIEDAFNELVAQGLEKDGRVGRRLYIYLAGHGIALGADDAGLLMANAGRGFFGNHIPGRSFANWFFLSAYFDEVALFMDCCRDPSSANRHIPPWDDVQTPGAGVKRLYVFATEWSRKSRERPVEANGQVQGLFTRALLEGLSGQAADEQGRVTGDSLKQFVINYLSKLLKENERQEPKFEGDDLVFVTGLPKPAVSATAATPAAPVAPVTLVRITFDNTPLGQLVELLDGKRKVIETHAAGTQGWELALEKGFYKLQAQNNGRGQLFEVIGEEVVNVSF